MSHRTPVLNALQLQITEFFQIPADITTAYRPSKTNTTALQRTCKSICSTRPLHLFLVQQSPSERSRQRHEIIRASITRMVHRSTLLTTAFAWQAARSATTLRQNCNGNDSAPRQCCLPSTHPTRSQSCMAAQHRTRPASTAQQPLSNCNVEPISYRQCTVPGSCIG